MLTLALLRHAKSSWATPGLDDFDRPLNPRGVSAAPVMGAELKRLGIAPDIVLCSPARRTRQTLELALPDFEPAGGQVRSDHDLYLASAEGLMAILRGIPEQASTALVIGHNPAMHNLALALAGSGSADDLTALADNFPTCALAVLTFDEPTWRGIDVRRGTLTHLITPRQLSRA